jgi:hypothetical protein
MKRVVYLVIDQLAGHWEESVKIEGTDLPPANVKGYHELGLIPNFSHLIDNGLWVKRPWNKGLCQTPCGMRYLATGSYLDEKACYDGSYKRPWYIESEKHMGFFEFAKRHYGEKLTAGIFSCSPWLSKGHFYVPEFMHAMVSGYADEVMLRQCALPWMARIDNPEIPLTWNLVHIYFPVMDGIGHSGAPSYGPPDSDPRSSKHSYLLFLDGLVGEITEYLNKTGIWDETCFVIAADHGYHLGCSEAAESGVTTNNQCHGHAKPYDCEVWDFEKNQSTGVYSGGPRRTTFILSGGALDEQYRGKTIEEAEIIDVIPTIADLLDVPYECQGKSVLRKSS